MRALYLIRHSLTEANERRLYGGSTDLPLSEQGRALAAARRGRLAACDVYVTSGMRRADETLRLMTGRAPDRVLDGLREMDFGAFEMKSYEQLKDDTSYINWINDAAGDAACPGGESANMFRDRVLAAGGVLLAMECDTACVVCHGGAIVNLMRAWFPGENRNFYEWQPGACGGYRVDVEEGRPAFFEEVGE